MGYHDDGHPLVGEAPQQAHHLPVSAFVETAGHLVEKEHAGTAENLAGQARALLLSATEGPDALIEPVE
jgi:hypothetical protein